MQNPLLNQGALPTFTNIIPEEIEPTLKALVAENRDYLNNLLNKQSHVTWDSFIAPLEEQEDKLSKMWAPIAHLHAVVESDELRAAYNACLPILTEYHTNFMQNTEFYQMICTIAESPDYAQLNDAQRKVIDNLLRDFRLAGVHLSPDKKERFGELQKALSKLYTQFAENLMDATQAFTLHLTDAADLKGLPDSALEIAAQNAKSAELPGWVFTLDHSSYSTVMKYLENRDLRQQMYAAYVTRASDQGPHAGRFDNSVIMEDILKIRHQVAELAGFHNFSEYSLATKMANKPEQVLNFLQDLVDKTKKTAQKEIDELNQFAKNDGVASLEAWDLAYYSEKLRKARFDFSAEELRAYFPINHVLNGMFTVMHKLFGLTIIEKTGVDIWHPHVQFFEIYDQDRQFRGAFYTDLYARAHKREGAWMDECRVRRILLNNQLQKPIAFLTCNFTRPLSDKPALLTHEDVQTLFHEFGHCLQHLLTKVDYSPVSGINGVPWDAVEFPSQFMEHWCFEKKALDLISSEEKTGAQLPDSLYQKLILAKNFHSGLQMMRQLEFALFDFKLHYEYNPNKTTQVQSTLDAVRSQVAVIKIPSFNRFQHSFSHIFAGGYASGYYSYKWAEVLSSDAFSLFKEKGIFNETTGRRFLTAILEQGGVYDPMKLFISFRGREPKIDALLSECGLL